VSHSITCLDCLINSSFWISTSDFHRFIISTSVSASSSGFSTGAFCIAAEAADEGEGAVEAVVVVVDADAGAADGAAGVERLKDKA
jgi:hypothetical protein